MQRYYATDAIDTAYATAYLIERKNQPPIAENDTLFFFKNTILDLKSQDGIGANDYDPDGNFLTYGLTEDVVFGRLNLDYNGDLTYWPPDNTDSTFIDSFIYYATDAIDTVYATAYLFPKKVKIDFLNINSETILDAGSDFKIDWQDNLQSEINIDLYKNNFFVHCIAEKISSEERSYNWQVLSVLENCGDYQLKISDSHNPDLFAFSDYFNIFNVENFDLQFVEGGYFEMGDKHSLGDSDEAYIHTVLVNDMIVSKYEVSIYRFLQFLNSGNIDNSCILNGNLLINIQNEKSPIKYLEDRFVFIPNETFKSIYNPVTFITWYGALEYCNWKSKNENLQEVYDISTNNIIYNQDANGYRLPTEAEWEYLASGAKFWNDNLFIRELRKIIF